MSSITSTADLITITVPNRVLFIKKALLLGVSKETGSFVDNAGATVNTFTLELFTSFGTITFPCDTLAQMNGGFTQLQTIITALP